MDITRDSASFDFPVLDRRPNEARLRATEADHRIANSLQIAASVLMQERRGIVDVDTAKAALQATAARLISMARLHRALSAVMPDDDIALEDCLSLLCESLAECVGATLRIDVGGVVLPASVAGRIGIVVSEMATNAVKHAPSGGAVPVLTVEADTNGLGEVRLRIYDDGPGFPEGFDLGGAAAGIGMTVIAATIERLGGYVYVLPRLGPCRCTGAGIEIVLPPKGRHPA